MRLDRLSIYTEIFPTGRFVESGGFVLNLAEGFNRAGTSVNVEVLASVLSLVRRRVLWFPRNRMVRGVPVHWSYFLSRGVPSLWSRGPRGRSEIFDRFYSAAKRKWSDRRAQYSTCLAYFSSTGIALLAARPASTIYVECGESDLEESRQRIGPTRFDEILPRAAGIVAVSRYNADWIRERYGDRVRVIHLPNPYNEAFFYFRPKSVVREELGMDGTKICVAFAGHFVERKGPLRVDAALQQTSAYGVFMGSGPQVPRSGRVLRASAVPNHDLGRWLSACDMLVLPSLAEGMATVIVEAMACGLPLVVSDRYFNRSFLTEANAVFVDPLSVDDIARGIRYLVDRPDVRAAMSAENIRNSEKFGLSYRIDRMSEFMSVNRL